MAEIDDLITLARATGDLHQLADYLRGRPMSPTGFIHTKHGSFGDGYMEDRSWLAVEVGVSHRGGLTRAQYDELCELDWSVNRTAVETFIGLAPDAWTAVGTVALALIALVTAWVAIQSIREARSSGRDAMRAYVSANFELHPHAHHVIEFVVRNSGRTAATDVQFEWIGSTPERVILMSSTPFVDATFFKGISTMAPGQEIRTFFDTTVERLNAEGTEHQFSIKVTYTDRFGRAHPDVFNLDTEIYRGMTYTGTKNIDHVGKALETIANEVKGSGIGRGQFHVVAEARTHWLARMFRPAHRAEMRPKRRRNR